LKEIRRHRHDRRPPRTMKIPSAVRRQLLFAWHMKRITTPRATPTADPSDSLRCRRVFSFLSGI
jgi:hypothetical protein